MTPKLVVKLYQLSIQLPAKMYIFVNGLNETSHLLFACVRILVLIINSWFSVI